MMEFVPGPVVIVVMGVSGCGKSTVGAMLADVLSCRFIEGDAFHSEESIRKMTRGIPLDDGDRWPWLGRLGEAVSGIAREEGAVVVACSALKRSYRDSIRMSTKCATCFIHLEAGEPQLLGRLLARTSHYMPASLLKSQIADLERPQRDEWAKTFSAMRESGQIVEDVRGWIRSGC
jgi:gluconokinase